jgi:hypothetical protein
MPFFKHKKQLQGAVFDHKMKLFGKFLNKTTILKSKFYRVSVVFFFVDIGRHFGESLKYFPTFPLYSQKKVAIK